MYRYKVVLKPNNEKSTFFLSSTLDLRQIQYQLQLYHSVELDNVLILQDALIFIEQISKEGK